MKVKVTMKFRDRHTKKMHRVGEEMEITQERYEEIMNVGAFVRVINENDAPAASEDDVNISSDEAENALNDAPAASGDKLDEMTVKELREYANSRFKVTFPAGTKKSEIIDEIRRMLK